MNLTYVRRFRMEMAVVGVTFPEPSLPFGYHILPWDASLLERHATVKYQSFNSEIDSQVFRCLGEFSGCHRLMTEIASQEMFLPQATWLITWQAGPGQEPIDCGTIQGIEQHGSIGAVQNVGVVPEHRGMGVGRALMLKALHGFRDAHLQHVCLEVTASNLPAVNLYRSLGFRLTRTMYKTVDGTPPEAACVY